MLDLPHLDSAAVARVALGECSGKEKHLILAHCAECRYCRERCQAACGHVVAAWEHAMATENGGGAARSNRHSLAWIPSVRPQFAQGGAVAAVAAVSLMLATSPELRHRMADIALAPARVETRLPRAAAQASAEPSPFVMEPAADPQPPVAIAALELPALAGGALNERSGLRRRVIASAPAREPQPFVPPATVRRSAPAAHSLVELPPPPPIRPHAQPAPQLVASVDFGDVPPPRKSKVGSFFHRAGSGMKTALGVFR